MFFLVSVTSEREKQKRNKVLFLQRLSHMGVLSERRQRYVESVPWKYREKVDFEWQKGTGTYRVPS